MGILGQDVSSKVIVLVLAIQEQKIAKGLRREGILLQQKLQLFKSLCWFVSHVHQGLIVQTDCVQLFLRPWGHISQRLPSSISIFEKIFNGRLQVECLDECGLVQGKGVSHTPDLDSFRLHSHAQLRMFPNSPLYDVGNVLERRRKVLQSVVTESNVVRKVGVVANNLLGTVELDKCLLVTAFLVEETSWKNRSEQRITQTII
jgi:hypothetical protein